MGRMPAKGGEWDMRTRLAFACEYAHLPFRLIYQMDCSANDRAAEFAVALPSERAMPAWRWNAVSDEWMDVADLRRAGVETYGLRLAALMCAAAFTLTPVDRVAVDLHASTVDGAFMGRVAVERRGVGGTCSNTPTGGWRRRRTPGPSPRRWLPIWRSPAGAHAFDRGRPARAGESAGACSRASMCRSRQHAPAARARAPAAADVACDLDVMTPDDAATLECEQQVSSERRRIRPARLRLA